MNRSDEHKWVRSILWLSLLPIFALFVAVTLFVTPLEVQESVKLLDRSQNEEALARLNRFLDNSDSTNHFALAYRTVAYAKLGNASQAQSDLYLAAAHKWTFGNQGRFKLLPGDTSSLSCTEAVETLGVEERYVTYLLHNLCADR